MKKTLGAIIILVGLIASFLVVISTDVSVPLGITGFTEANRDIITWIVIRLLPTLGFLLLILPIGIFYIRANIFSKLQKTAFWLHLSSMIIIVIGSIPYLSCLTGISCEGEGIGEVILITIIAFPSVAIYLIGMFLLIISWFKDRN
jgi:hypothetical protein